MACYEIMAEVILTDVIMHDVGLEGLKYELPLSKVVV